MREKSYEKPSLTNRQLEIFKSFHQMDYILYDLSLKKFERQLAAFGHKRMEAEVKKLKLYAEGCEMNPENCLKSKFTTVRNSPKYDQIMQLTKVTGEKIGKRISKDYGEFNVCPKLMNCQFFSRKAYEEIWWGL